MARRERRIQQGLHRADHQAEQRCATWSDGTPVTANDVVFTFDSQLKNDKLPYHGQFDAVREGSQASPMTRPWS